MPARSKKNEVFILLKRWKRMKFYYQWKHWTPKGLIEILCSTNVLCFYLRLLTLPPLQIIISEILSKKRDFVNFQVFGNIFANEIHFTLDWICSFNKRKKITNKLRPWKCVSMRTKFFIAIHLFVCIIFRLNCRLYFIIVQREH